MSSLFLLILLLLWPHSHDKPPCSSFMPEKVPVYERGELYGYSVEGSMITLTAEGVKKWKNESYATVTLMGGRPYIKTGEKIDQEAIKHNKEVRKCLSAIKE
jgi:hypothetical protein